MLTDVISHIWTVVTRSNVLHAVCFQDAWMNWFRFVCTCMMFWSSHTNSVNTVTSPDYFFPRKWPISAICLYWTFRACSRRSSSIVCISSDVWCKYIIGPICQVFFFSVYGYYKTWQFSVEWPCRIHLITARAESCNEVQDDFYWTEWGCAIPTVILHN